MAPYIICIDGNIGAGKSTILDEMKNRGYTVYTEDIHDWMWVLDKCYIDSTRWAFTLQIAALNSMVSQKKYIDQLESQIVFVERCPVSTMVFTNTWYSKGCLTDDEYILLKKVYELVTWSPNITFMMTTDCNTCYDRMNCRGRTCEKSLSIEHLKEVQNQYDALYADRVNVIPLKSDEHDASVKTLADKLESFVKNVTPKL